MVILVGISIFVGALLTATIWSAIRGTARLRSRRSDRPYAL